MAANEQGCVRNRPATRHLHWFAKAIDTCNNEHRAYSQACPPTWRSWFRQRESERVLVWSFMVTYGSVCGRIVVEVAGEPSPCLILSLLLRSSNCGVTPSVSPEPFSYRTAKHLIALLSSKVSETGRFCPSTHPSHPRLDQRHRGHQSHHHSSARYLQTHVAGTTCMVTRWKMTRRATTAHSAMPSWMRSTSPHMDRTRASASFRGWSKCASRTSIRK